MQKTIRKIMILFLIMVLIICLKVQAASFSFTAEPNKTKLKPGEELTINISLENIDSETGITAIQGKIAYDETIFEKVSIQSLNNWSITYNDIEDNELKGNFVGTILSNDGITEDQTIAKLTFKVREDAEAETTQIEFTNIETSNDNMTMEEKEEIVEIEIEEKTSDAEDTNNKSVDDNKNNNLEKQSISVNSNVDTDIPKTGILEEVMLKIFISIFATFAIISYLRYKKLKNIK